MPIEVRYDVPPVGAAYSAGIAEAQRENARLAIAQQAAQADMLRAMTANSAAQQHSTDQADDRTQRALITSAELGSRYDLHAMDQQAQIARDYRLNDMEMGRDRLRFQMAQQHDERTFEQQRQMELLRTGMPLTFGEAQRMQRLNADMDRIAEEEGRGSLQTQEANRLRMQIAPELNYFQARVQAARQRQERETLRSLPLIGPDGQPMMGPDGQPMMMPAILDQNGVPHPAPNWISPEKHAELELRRAQAAELEARAAAHAQDRVDRNVMQATERYERETQRQLDQARTALIDRNTNQPIPGTPENNFGMPFWARRAREASLIINDRGTGLGGMFGIGRPAPTEQEREQLRLMIPELLARDQQDEIQRRVQAHVSSLNIISPRAGIRPQFDAQGLAQDQAGMEGRAPDQPRNVLDELRQRMQGGQAPPPPVNVQAPEPPAEERNLPSSITPERVAQLNVIAQSQGRIAASRHPLTGGASATAGGELGVSRHGVSAEDLADARELQDMLRDLASRGQGMSRAESANYLRVQQALETRNPAIGRLFNPLASLAPEQTAYSSIPSARLSGLRDAAQETYNRSNWFGRGMTSSRTVGQIYELINPAVEANRPLSPNEVARYLFLWRQLPSNLQSRFQLHNRAP